MRENSRNGRLVDPISNKDGCNEFELKDFD
jgi:hypothetical protein